MGYMRIDKNERIAGLPALQVRRLLREIGESHIDVDATAKILATSKAKASKALAILLRRGLLVEDNDKCTLTIAGRALAAATAAKPLLTKTAERLVEEVLSRARLVNEADAFAYCVELIGIFGSVASGRERPNDVDIACKLVPRYDDEELQTGLENLRRETKRGRFANTLEWAYWPQLEVLKYLKNHSKSLSIHPFDEAIKIDSNYRILYDKRTIGSPAFR
jgi:predicted nucleotidyltransferase